MKKRHIFYATVTAFTVWAAVTYPKIGHLSYDALQSIEAWQAGFSKKTQAVNGEFGTDTIVYYETEKPSADAETILLVHGYSADKDTWNRLAKHLSTHYHLIAPDIGGHGETGFADRKDYSPPMQAARMRALMQSKNIQQFHIAGSSLGGSISAHYALAYPQDLKSLALFNPYGVQSPSPSVAKQLLEDKGRNIFLMSSREEFDFFIEQAMEDVPFLPGMSRAALTERYIERRDTLAKLHSFHWQVHLIDHRLADIKTRTWILWGQQDEILDVSDAKVWDAGVPNSTLTVWDGVGHLPMLERPEETANHYLAFLKQ